MSPEQPRPGATALWSRAQERLLPPGSQVAGYRIESALDRPSGAYVAYEATDLRSEARVVLKLIEPWLGEDPAFRARFLEDLLLQASLREAHILRVLDGGKSQHGLYLVTSGTAGATLAEQEGQRLEAGHVVRLLGAVAGALDGAHALDLVHGYMRPSSIWIDADGQPRLDDLCLSGAGGATGYAAPEQAGGAAPTPRSDVYTLAVIGCECLTGARPSPTAGPAGVPAPLDAPLRRALSPEPEQRQRSAGELVRELGSAPAPAERPRAPVAAPRPRPPAASAPPAPPAATPPVAWPEGDRNAAVVWRPEPTRRRGRMAAVVLVLAAATAAGLALAGGETKPGRPAARPVVLRSWPLELTAPAGWRAPSATPSVPGLAYDSQPVALTPSGAEGAVLVAGRVTAEGPTFVPGRTAAALADPLPRPELVSLGELRALRYAGLQPAGGDEVLNLYAVPTSVGVVSIACIAPTNAAVALLRSCERVAATVRIRGAAPVELAPRAEYGAGLSSIMRRLSTTRAPELAKLGGSNRARSASRLAGAFAAAGRDLEAIQPPEATAQVHASIARALRSTEQAYALLAGAARRQDASAYRRAARAVTAGERDVRRSLQSLEILGYTVG